MRDDRARLRRLLGLGRRVGDRQNGQHTSDLRGNDVSSPSLTTAQPGELLIAFITSDGPSAGGSQTISKVSGGSLAWRLRRRANTQAGTTEIWQASAATTLNNVKVTATLGNGS